MNSLCPPRNYPSSPVSPNDVQPSLPSTSSSGGSSAHNAPVSDLSTNLGSPVLCQTLTLGPCTFILAGLGPSSSLQIINTSWTKERTSLARRHPFLLLRASSFIRLITRTFKICKFLLLPNQHLSSHPQSHRQRTLMPLNRRRRQTHNRRKTSLSSHTRCEDYLRKPRRVSTRGTRHILSERCRRSCPVKLAVPLLLTRTWAKTGGIPFRSLLHVYTRQLLPAAVARPNCHWRGRTRLCIGIQICGSSPHQNRRWTAEDGAFYVPPSLAHLVGMWTSGIGYRTKHVGVQGTGE